MLIVTVFDARDIIDGDMVSLGEFIHQFHRIRLTSTVIVAMKNYITGVHNYIGLG